METRMQIFMIIFGIYFLLATIWVYENMYKDEGWLFIFGMITGILPLLMYIPLLPGLFIAWVCSSIFPQFGVYHSVLIVYILIMILLMLISFNVFNFPVVIRSRQIKWIEATKYTPIEQIDKLPSRKKEKAYILSRIEKIYVTKATIRELEMKRTGIFHSIKKIVRGRLVYHTNPNCEFALKDYVVNGELIALNSGIIASEYKYELALCRVCSKEIENSISGEIQKSLSTKQKVKSATNSNYGKRCIRCGGSGYLPQYRHVEGGTCFRCGGSGKC